MPSSDQSMYVLMEVVLQSRSVQNKVFFLLTHHITRKIRSGVLVCMKNVCGFGHVRVVGEFMVCARECACDLMWQGLVCATCRCGVGSFSGCPLAGCNRQACQACLLQQTSGPRKCGNISKHCKEISNLHLCQNMPRQHLLL